MKKTRNFCKILMWGVIGSFIGKALHVYFFYKQNPGILELISVPWYEELIMPLIITAIIVAALLIIRLVLKKKVEER